MSGETRSGPRLLGAVLLWFAALGGAVAYAVHLFAAWGIEELVCAAGHREVAGVPLEVVIAIATAVPGLVVLAALATAWLAWRRIGRRIGQAEPVEDQAGLTRAKLLAVVGLWANLLFLAIIVFDGVALVVIPTCQS